jgi:hypothetical protein
MQCLAFNLVPRSPRDIFSNTLVHLIVDIPKGIVRLVNNVCQLFSMTFTPDSG